jgi:hypothetical protein
MAGVDSFAVAVRRRLETRRVRPSQTRTKFHGARDKVVRREKGRRGGRGARREVRGLRRQRESPPSPWALQPERGESTADQIGTQGAGDTLDPSPGTGDSASTSCGEPGGFQRARLDRKRAGMRPSSTGAVPFAPARPTSHRPNLGLDRSAGQPSLALPQSVLCPLLGHTRVRTNQVGPGGERVSAGAPCIGFDPSRGPKEKWKMSR